jgi:hypothetical protein
VRYGAGIRCCGVAADRDPPQMKRRFSRELKRERSIAGIRRFSPKNRASFRTQSENSDAKLIRQLISILEVNEAEISSQLEL